MLDLNNQKPAANNMATPKKMKSFFMRWVLIADSEIAVSFKCLT